MARFIAYVSSEEVVPYDHAANQGPVEDGSKLGLQYRHFGYYESSRYLLSDSQVTCCPRQYDYHAPPSPDP